MPPNWIDILTAISGVAFEDAWPNRAQGVIDGLPVFFIGLEDLIRNKVTAGRSKDKGDAGALMKRRPRAKSKRRTR